ncbi:MAG: cytochrome c family protein [Pseudomonadota bacterium]
MWTKTLRAAALLGCLNAPSLTLAAGDADAGEREFRACRSCHQLDAGKNGAGPSLAGLFGATAGQVDGFRYSDEMVASGIVWTAETLDAFLADPKGLVPSTSMGYRGLRNDTKRADLIAYLARETAAE